MYIRPNDWCARHLIKIPRKIPVISVSAIIIIKPKNSDLAPRPTRKMAARRLSAYAITVVSHTRRKITHAPFIFWIMSTSYQKISCHCIFFSLHLGATQRAFFWVIHASHVRHTSCQLVSLKVAFISSTDHFMPCLSFAVITTHCIAHSVPIVIQKV